MAYPQVLRVGKLGQKLGWNMEQVSKKEAEQASQCSS